MGKKFDILNNLLGKSSSKDARLSSPEVEEQEPDFDNYEFKENNIPDKFFNNDEPNFDDPNFFAEFEKKKNKQAKLASLIDDNDIPNVSAPHIDTVVESQDDEETIKNKIAHIKEKISETHDEEDDINNNISEDTPHTEFEETFDRVVVDHHNDELDDIPEIPVDTERMDGEYSKFLQDEESSTNDVDDSNKMDESAYQNIDSNENESDELLSMDDINISTEDLESFEDIKSEENNDSENIEEVPSNNSDEFDSLSVASVNSFDDMINNTEFTDNNSDEIPDIQGINELNIEEQSDMMIENESSTEEQNVESNTESVEESVNTETFEESDNKEDNSKSEAQNNDKVSVKAILENTDIPLEKPKEVKKQEIPVKRQRRTNAMETTKTNETFSKLEKKIIKKLLDKACTELSISDDDIIDQEDVIYYMNKLKTLVDNV